MTSLSIFAFLTLCSQSVTFVDCQATPATPTEDQGSIMNIWNYQIERKVKTSVAYKIWDLAVWEEVGPNATSTVDRRYYVTPPVTFIAGSARCKYTPVMQAYEVVYDVQVWERELPRVVVERLREMGLNIREDQVHPLPFYQARVVWNNNEQQLQGLKLASAWTNNLQQQNTYTFHIAANTNESCQLLADTLRTSPHDIVDFFQLQFTVSAAKIDSKLLTVKSEHIMNSQLASSLKNLPGADGAFRYLSSKDYNHMLLQIGNQVMATEITSGDYVDAEDELSLKDTVASMLNAQKMDPGSFDERMWNSTFWDPLDERPDRVNKEMNKYFKLNQTDNRWYMTESSSSSTSAKVNAVVKAFPVGAEASHSSSQSMTTDQMQHLLEQYDIESDIEGDKFIPKKLDLLRLNVNDLSRGDLVTEKRVRVRQVDIGGVLQVAVGNSSMGQMEDENRFLRQQINDMQQQLLRALQKQDTLESAVNYTENALNQSIDTIANRYTDLTNRLLHSAFPSPSSSGTCTQHNTPDNDEGNNLDYLDRHDISCPEGKVLTRWHVLNLGGMKIHVEFTCCSLI